MVLRLRLCLYSTDILGRFWLGSGRHPRSFFVVPNSSQFYPLLVVDPAQLFLLAFVDLLLQEYLPPHLLQLFLPLPDPILQLLLVRPHILSPHLQLLSLLFRQLLLHSLPVVLFALIEDDVAGGVLVLELLLKLVIGHLVALRVLDPHRV